MWIREEHDACALVVMAKKSGQPSHGNVVRTLSALAKMDHRAGLVAGEGDGAGILVDLPRRLWQARLEEEGVSGRLAWDEDFVVAHIFAPPSGGASQAYRIRQLAEAAGLTAVYLRVLPTHPETLGPAARAEEPVIWALAGIWRKARNRDLFRLQVALEQTLGVHVASLSRDTVVYKVRGSARVLAQYYPDLLDPRFESACTVGHNRFSTNTTSTFSRVQPFTLLGHNGEINTIKKLRLEASQLGASIEEGGSDSQDLNRFIEHLLAEADFTLLEAMALVFPPIIHEIKQMPAPMRQLSMWLRQAWGPFAQGPAAIISRAGQECVLSVDAMGLRPLWLGETEKEWFASSEQGILPATAMKSEPRPLAPGEKVLLQLAASGVSVVADQALDDLLAQRFGQRFGDAAEGAARWLDQPFQMETSVPSNALADVPFDRLLAAFGWDQEDRKLVQEQATAGKEAIGSLGFDGPLAALSDQPQNIADYCKETVAVVTNPAVDREREIEHFSTRAVLGRRPGLWGPHLPAPLVELQVPVVTSVAPLTELFGAASATLSLALPAETPYSAALDALGAAACQRVRSGVALLILDDEPAWRSGEMLLDPHLAVAAVDAALRAAQWADGTSLRRRTGVLLRAGALRNLHDLALAFGLGADAVAPYALFQVACEGAADAAGQTKRLLTVLQHGLEKVISTLGIHELRGYGRNFAAIGLAPAVAERLGIVSYCSSAQAGLDWTDLAQEAARRRDLLLEGGEARLARTFHFSPRVWKAAGEAASGLRPYMEYATAVHRLEAEHPISLRHVLSVRGLKPTSALPSAPEVDLSVGEHALPFLISSMSFGSQGELAYRAYAEAAAQLGIIGLSGEGGEIPDLINRYPRHRGLQIASGRFGVNVALANSANYLEIKIGQGAKPGEGGHLPGRKVSAKVAAARHASVGVDLISPSNNHDLYSIEDLAQLIEELKTANPEVKVAVKVPAIPGIGTIAVGIAKAGADIITLSGYDGGTGAARRHALQHVGFPAELGIKEAHLALSEAGLRGQVELWADGGMRTGLDVLKLVLLGANRVGFGTLAMVAMGCTVCRGCQLDTCHVGIATQIEDEVEAAAKGLKRFVPRQFDAAVRHLCHFFSAMGDELRSYCAQLGVGSLQALVGRSELLQQVAAHERLDLGWLVAPAPGLQAPLVGTAPRVVRLTRPQNHFTAQIAAQTRPWLVEEGSLVLYEDDATASPDRAVGTRLAGMMTRQRVRITGSEPRARLHFKAGSVPGNGLASFLREGLDILVEGGAQDGVGKAANGGTLAVLKARNYEGRYVDGSVGKGLAYGAQGGRFYIQGMADSRACIRLSGADVVLGGRLTQPVADAAGGIARRATVKGFAFEYMTAGRAVVLGDPGPWCCAGMTGGVVYLHLQPHLGLDDAALRRRLAKGAAVRLEPLTARGVRDLEELLGGYAEILEGAGQREEAAWVRGLLAAPEQRFRQVVPEREQTDQTVATE